MNTIHNKIADNDLPECLKQKPEFGNRKQINALRNLESVILEHEERQKGIESGMLKKFQVTISFEGETEIEVWATDEKQAEEKAQDEEDISRYDIDCWDVDYCAYEVKPKNKGSATTGIIEPKLVVN